MLWILVILVTGLAFCAFYYAAKSRGVNAPELNNEAAVTALLRAQLAEAELDLANGRLAPSQIEAVRGEIAREMLRIQTAGDAPSATKLPPARLLIVTFAAIAGIAFVTYATLGSPNLPTQPLATRVLPEAARSVDVDEAIAKVEERLRTHPDDARGWSVLGPVYMRAGKYAEAVTAFRNVLRLLPATADAETDLAEALIQVNGGDELVPEAGNLLNSAAKRDPKHVRSRFYLATAAMRSGNYETAVIHWEALVNLASGDETWLAMAQDGLESSKRAIAGEPIINAEPADQQEMIRGMVEGLSARLDADGGSIEEWTRLVRARIVLGEIEAAQRAYDSAKEAFTDAERTEMDSMAKQAGLK